MSKIYEKYFANNDMSTAKSRLMYDIEHNVVYGDDLIELLDEIKAKGLFIDKHFQKEPALKWTEEYLHSLSFGFLADYFSKDYLIYFAEVADYIEKKKLRKKLLLTSACTLAAVVIIAILIKMLSK